MCDIQQCNTRSHSAMAKELGKWELNYRVLILTFRLLITQQSCELSLKD